MKKWFLHTVGHCVDEVGQRVYFSTSSLGEATIEFGGVAFISDEFDYGFIEIDEADRELVDAALKGHPKAGTGRWSALWAPEQPDCRMRGRRGLARGHVRRCCRFGIHRDVASCWPTSNVTLY